MKDQLQTLPEEQKFIEKYGKDWKNKSNWSEISRYQRLSEAFIERHAARLNWYYISRYQSLSEAFIERHCDSVNWYYISYYQRLSEAFIERHCDKLDKEVQLRRHHRRYDLAAEAQQYAERHGLKVQDGYLYAYRNHDQHGHGCFNKTICYDKCEPHEYRDWHCDLDPNEENSFGLGIWSCGNTAVKVALKDFGCEVRGDNDGDGKARVWAFQIVGKG